MALAPLLAIWIGEGFLATVAVVFIISLFPIITNATDADVGSVMGWGFVDASIE